MPWVEKIRGFFKAAYQKGTFGSIGFYHQLKFNPAYSEATSAATTITENEKRFCPGGLLSSAVLRCGRRNSLLAVSLPFSASWLLTVFASSVEMLLATAFLAGICSAIVIVVSQVSRLVTLLELQMNLR